MLIELSWPYNYTWEQLSGEVNFLMNSCHNVLSTTTTSIPWDKVSFSCVIGAQGDTHYRPWRNVINDTLQNALRFLDHLDNTRHCWLLRAPLKSLSHSSVRVQSLEGFLGKVREKEGSHFRDRWQMNDRAGWINQSSGFSILSSGVTTHCYLKVVCLYWMTTNLTCYLVSRFWQNLSWKEGPSIACSHK